MASVIVTLGQIAVPNVYEGVSCRSETITSSGTAASGALAAAKGDIAQIYCDTAVYARSGATAAASNSVYCQAGVMQYIRMTEGAVVSVIDA